MSEASELKKVLDDHRWYDDPEEGTVCIGCGRNRIYLLTGPEIEPRHADDCEIAKALDLPTDGS